MVIRRVGNLQNHQQKRREEKSEGEKRRMVRW